jgi:MFS family permease
LTHPDQSHSSRVTGEDEQNSNLLVRATVAVLIGTLLLRLAGGLATSSLGLYLSSLGQRGESVGLVAAGYYATELILAPVFGALSDRWGRKGLLVGAPFLGAIALLLYPLSSSVAVLFAIRVLEGISAAAATPATLGYLSDLTDGSRHRSRVMGLFEIVTLLGLALGSTVLGPRVWEALGTSAYPILAVVYALGALIFWLGLPQIGVRVHKRRTVQDYLRALGSRRLLRFMPAWIAATAIVGLWTVHLQNQMIATSGSKIEGQALAGALTGSQISNALGLFALAFVAGLYFGSRSTGRRTTPMLHAAFGLLGLTFCLYVLNHPNSPLALGLPTQVWFVGLLVGAFFQAGFTPVALAYLADISEDFPEDRGVVVGLYSIFLAGGNLFGGAIGGLVVGTLHVDGIVLMTFLLTLVAFGSVLYIRRISSD